MSFFKSYFNFSEWNSKKYGAEYVAFFSFFIASVLFSFIVFLNMGIASNPEKIKDPLSTFLETCSYLASYKMNFNNYLFHSFNSLIVVSFNIIIFTMIIKTLITGKCNFFLFKNKSLINIFGCQLFSLIFLLPLLIELTLFSFIFIFIFSFIIRGIIYLFNEANSKFSQSCSCSS